MVKTEEIYIGMKIRMVDNKHVYGTVHSLRPLGQKKWFKVELSSGEIRLVQRPEEWQVIS